MQRITKTQLAANLEKAIRCDVGMQGLNTLLYGWKQYRHFGAKYCKVLLNRDFLCITEVLDLSEYAGYDLTQ